MGKQKQKIEIVWLTLLSVFLLSNSSAFAAELGEAITGYLKSPESYNNPSNIQAKVTERTNFCSCVMSSGPALFDGCTPIHPVLPNLPPSFIRNRLLNEFLVSSTSNTKTAAQIATDLQSKLTTCPTYANTFTSQFTVTNSSYSIGDPSSYVDEDPGGITAGAENFCEGMAPNDPLFNEQWGLCETADTAGHPSNIKAANAWDTTEGDDEIVVAVIDTGVDYTHEDFQRGGNLPSNIWVNDDPIGDIADTCDRVAAPSIALADDDCNGKIDDVRGWNFAENNADPMDTNGHGTEMAGVIASVMYNNMGVAGVCPNCKIMPLRVDPASFPASQVAAAVGYAIQEGADIINMSFFERYATTDPDPYADAKSQLLTAYQDGIVLVAAAGNYTDDSNNSAILNTIRRKAYPAAFGFSGSASTEFDVIAVAGTNPNNERAKGFKCPIPGTSNTDLSCTTIFGPWVDISAPGFNIASTVPPSHPDFQPDDDGYVASGYFKAGGSSHASAHVAGVAALIKSMNPDVNQDLTSILGNCYFPENIVTTNRCGPNLDQRCFHDYVRELMKVTASCFAAKPYAAAEFSDFGAGLLNANEAVESVEVVPGENLAPVLSGLDLDFFQPETADMGIDINSDGYADDGGVSLHSDKSARFKVIVSDPNVADALTITMESGFALQGDNAFDPVTRMFNWTPTVAEISSARIPTQPPHGLGTFGVRFTINDGRGGVTAGPYIPINVPWNCPPYLTGPANLITVNQGETINFSLSGHDGCLIDGAQYQGISFHPAPQFSPSFILNPLLNLNPPPQLTTISYQEHCDRTTGLCTYTIPRLDFTWTPAAPINALALSFYISDRGAIVYDAAGNLIDDPILNPPSRLTDEHTVFVTVLAPPDTTPPTANIASPGSCTTSSAPSLQATVSDASGLLNYAVRLYNTSTNSLVSSLPVTSLSPSATSIPAYSPPTLNYGNYRYELDVRDVNNNLRTVSKSFSRQSSCGSGGTNPGNNGSGSSGCFLPGTPITMADGSMKSIESVVIGDQVAAFDEKTGELVTDTVSQVFIHNDIHSGYLEINDMKVTSEHPLWIKDKGWTKAGEVKAGDILLRQDNTGEPITHVKQVDGKYTVHNLETQPHHTYYAQGKRVHNKAALPDTH